jgi:hypothetical protein
VHRRAVYYTYASKAPDAGLINLYKPERPNRIDWFENNIAPKRMGFARYALLESLNQGDQVFDGFFIIAGKNVNPANAR